MKLNLLMMMFLIGFLPNQKLDKVKLKTGEKFKGKVVYIDGDVLEMKTQYGVVTIKRRLVKKMDIASIDKKIRTKSLIAHYDFNGTTRDVSKCEHHGKVKRAKWAKDRFKKRKSALYFDGHKDAVFVKSDKDLAPKKDLTITAWVKPTSGYAAHQVVRKGLKKRRSVQASYSLQSTGGYNNRWQFGITGKNGQMTLIKDTKPMEVNRWSMLTATYNGDVLKLYVNGELRSSRRVSSKIAYSNMPLVIGKGTRKGFKGTIDDIRIYDKALTEKEIRTIYFRSE